MNQAERVIAIIKEASILDQELCNTGTTFGAISKALFNTSNTRATYAWLRSGVLLEFKFGDGAQMNLVGAVDEA